MIYDSHIFEGHRQTAF